MSKQGTQKIGMQAYEFVETRFSRIFGDAWNPFYNLGALSFFFFWIIAVTGIYLYIFFETSITSAYASIEAITYDHYYVGGLMRSLHRYASDAMVVTMTLHFTREFLMGRFRGARWFSWVTGVPLIWLVFASGVNGYWLVWDELAQFVAIITSEWIDWLPIFGAPMAQNFLNEASLSDRFFSLLAFLHIGIPLFLLLMMWLHIQRMPQARSNPPRGLAVATLLALVVLSIAQPAISHPPANLDKVVTTVDLDWFYLNLYPLMDSTTPRAIWIFLGTLTTVLVAIPWMFPKRKTAVAKIDLANCNGCERCFLDCPYDAVTMQPRTDGLPFAQQAVVADNLCVGCGICVGACPTATPFRRQTELVAGVELPDFPLITLREQISVESEKLSGETRVIVFACREGGNFSGLAQQDVAVITLPCIAMLPPPFIDYVISKSYADGVFLTGCEANNCYHRYGTDWVEQRILGVRDPHLRKRVPRERLSWLWAGKTHYSQLLQQLDNFKTQLKQLGPRRVITMSDIKASLSSLSEDKDRRHHEPD